jgi:hypothetical protein
MRISRRYTLLGATGLLAMGLIILNRPAIAGAVSHSYKHFANPTCATMNAVMAVLRALPVK